MYGSVQFQTLVETGLDFTEAWLDDFNKVVKKLYEHWDRLDESGYCKKVKTDYSDKIAKNLFLFKKLNDDLEKRE